MWIFLHECFLAHPEPDLLAREVGKALDFHLESLPRGFTHILFLLLFFLCPEIQEFISLFQMSRYLEIPFPTKSSKAFSIEAFSL